MEKIFKHRKTGEIAAKNYLRDNEKKYSLNDIKETVKKLLLLTKKLIK